MKVLTNSIQVCSLKSSTNRSLFRNVERQHSSMQSEVVTNRSLLRPMATWAFVGHVGLRPIAQCTALLSTSVHSATQQHCATTFFSKPKAGDIWKMKTTYLHPRNSTSWQNKTLAGAQVPDSQDNFRPGDRIRSPGYTGAGFIDLQTAIASHNSVSISTFVETYRQRPQLQYDTTGLQKQRTTQQQHCQDNHARGAHRT